MQGNIMPKIMNRLDNKMKMEHHHILLFLDNTTSHVKYLGKSLTNIKLIFLPNSAKSKLLPLDAY